MENRVQELLRAHGICRPRPSGKRSAKVVLFTDSHPTRRGGLGTSPCAVCLQLSRACTVYNTLNLFVRKGCCARFQLGEGPVVYDPKMSAHHHFIDERSGRILMCHAGCIEGRCGGQNLDGLQSARSSGHPARPDGCQEVDRRPPRIKMLPSFWLDILN